VTGVTLTPPHNLNAEEALLGAMLLSRDAIDDTYDLITAEDFYNPAHGHTFTAINDLYEQGAPVDPVTVADELRRVGLLDVTGGHVALLDLQANTPAISNARRYARIVTELATCRAAVKAGTRLSSLGYSGDATAVIDRTPGLMEAVVTGATDTTARFAPTLVSAYRQQMDLPFDGVPTGFPGIDDRVGGWLKGEMNLLGAISGGYKSSALIVSMIAACRAKRPVLAFSLEMPEAQVLNRMIAVIGQIELWKLTRRALSKTERTRREVALKEIETWPLVVDDDQAPTLPGMKAKARLMAREFGEVGLCAFDYLQLWKPTSSENRQAEVTEASRLLKGFAKEYRVPVLAAVQLNNLATTRVDRRPQRQDIRESTTPYHDAAVVVFLYREGQYNTECATPDLVELIIDKNRNGEPGTEYADRVARWATLSGRQATNPISPPEDNREMMAANAAGYDGAGRYDPDEF
jgi:replicative DNA helicase